MFSSYFYFCYLNVTAFASLLANSVPNARPNAISCCHLLEDFWTFHNPFLKTSNLVNRDLINLECNLGTKSFRCPLLVNHWLSCGINYEILWEQFLCIFNFSHAHWFSTVISELILTVFNLVKGPKKSWKIEPLQIQVIPQYFENYYADFNKTWHVFYF